MDNEIYDQTCSLLGPNCVNRPFFLQAKRIIVNGHVIYSRLYERMKKHCGFAVLVYASGGNYMAFVEYFLCEKDVKLFLPLLSAFFWILINHF